MKQNIEIICIGNELLIGKTLNTNAQWLAKRATSLGMDVKRITVIGDYVSEIASTLLEVLRRRPNFVVSTGGLGPTFDDKTLEGIAFALRRKLTVNREALEMVRAKYEARFQRKMLKTDLTPARIKMATLPKNAKPLRNPVGTAPGVLISIRKSQIFVLPGVPPEMEAIFDESVAPLLRKAAGNAQFFEASIYVKGIVESTLAPLIDVAMRETPQVYVKSHVYLGHQPSELRTGRPCIELHLSTTAEKAQHAKDLLDKSISRLSELVEQSGGKVQITQ